MKYLIKIFKNPALLLLIPTILIVWGYDKEFLLSLPYSWIQKQPIQLYLSIVPHDSMYTDFAALITGLVLLLYIIRNLVRRKDIKILHRWFHLLSSISLIVVSAIVMLTRSNVYSIKLINNYPDQLGDVRFDKSYKIWKLAPNNAAWVLYSSRYPNEKDNWGETWHIVSFKVGNSSHTQEIVVV